MKKIIARLKNVSRFILTSATDMEMLPDFLNLTDPIKLNFLEQNAELKQRLRVHRVDSDGRDKLDSLLSLLLSIYADNPSERTIVFVNHRESAERVADFLSRSGVDCALYHGALEQRDREKALALFNNGSAPVLVATDLASRGLDIADVSRVIHYHQPLTAEAYTHRNGRTARVDREGDVYLLIGPDEQLKPFVCPDDTLATTGDASRDKGIRSARATIYISAGRKEKLSRGDIVGFLIKEGGLSSDDVGKINVYDHYSLVAVPRHGVRKLTEKLSALKIKGKKRLISVA